MARAEMDEEAPREDLGSRHPRADRRSVRGDV
jgi:hypothetical protein